MMGNGVILYINKDSKGMSRRFRSKSKEYENNTEQNWIKSADKSVKTKPDS